MPKSNKELALEAINVVIAKGVTLSAAVREVAPDASNPETVRRAAQRILAQLPDMDQAVDAAYTAADRSGTFIATPSEETGRWKKRPTWERVEWTQFNTPGEPLEGRVERRAFEIEERKRKPPIVRYEWRVQEERPDGQRGFQTEAYPSRAEAEEVFGKWAARRRPRRPGTPRSQRSPPSPGRAS